jgi:hypothetical protein
MSSPEGFPPLGHAAASDAGAAAGSDSPCTDRSELSVRGMSNRGKSRGRKARASRDPSEEFYHHRSALSSSARASSSHAYDAEDPRVVFVGGVPYDLSANAVSDEFESKFGSVMDVRLVPHRKGKDGEHKGYGFVTFAEESTARSARDAGEMTLNCGVIVEIGRAEKGVGRFSDDRSSTTTAVSIESGLSEAASFHSYLLARHGGYPTGFDSASGSESGWHGASAGGGATHLGPPRGRRGGRRATREGGSQSSSRDGGSRDGSHHAQRNRATGSNGNGGVRTVGGRGRSGGRRQQTQGELTGSNRPPLPPFATKEARSTTFQDAYWMFRERLEYGFAFESALRDFYDEHGLTPPSALPSAPIAVPGPEGVFPVTDAVVAAAAEPFVNSAEPFATPLSTGGIGAREIFVGGLPMDTRDRDLEWFFSHWGTVEGSRVMHDSETGVSRRFGFVRFAAESAATAVKALGVVHFADGTPVEVGDVSRARQVAARPARRESHNVTHSDLSDLSAALAAAKLGPDAASAGAGDSPRVSRDSAASGASSGAGTPGSASTADTDDPILSLGGETGGAKTEEKRAASPPTVLRRRAT